MEMYLFLSLMALSLGLFVLPKGLISPFQLLLQLGLGALSSYWAATVLHSGETLRLLLPLRWYFGDFILTIDPLAAFFILIINFTALMGAFYGHSYLRPYRERKSGLFMGWHSFNLLWLQISLILVVSLQTGMAFLLAWELMSLASFCLVLFEADKPQTLKTAFRYLVQMHIGFLLLLVGFIYAQLQSNTQLGFSGLMVYFQNASNPLPVFILFFFGFGIKAGIVPFHSWLPQAHPAAPSHVSAVMSGIMIKMGIYGIIRVLMQVNSPTFGLAAFIIVMGLVTGIYGISNAIVRKDMKELLAYSSIENIGIICLGLGASVLGKVLGLPQLETLAMAGALLHILNHSLFKSTLFFSAGIVYQQTHTRYIEHLGGLIKKMPNTAALSLVACLAICGLPPFNGFVSEYLIYTGLFKSLSAADLSGALLLLLAIISLALIGGLALFAFTRMFSVVFLGSPRNAAATHAQEAALAMRWPMWLNVALMLGVGLFGWAMLPAMHSVLGQLNPDISHLQQAADGLFGVSAAAGLLLLLVGLIYAFRTQQQKQVEISHNLPWGCGYDYRESEVPLHQYTGTSYAANYVELTNSITGSQKKPILYQETEIFPQAREFKAVPYDKLSKKLTEEPAQQLLRVTEKVAVFQTGSLQHYVLYALAFAGAIFALTYAGWI